MQRGEFSCAGWRWAAIASAALAACSGARNPAPTTTPSESAPAAAHDTGWRITHFEAEPQNWLSHGLNYQETRHSPLAAISTANVSRLGLLWSYDLDTHRGQESTPLVVDGVLYTSSAWSKVQAFDAASGRLLWQFDPEVPRASAINGCCDVVNRGVAYWAGKVYVGTFDGRLVAIDAKTGQPVWSTVTVDQSRPYSITGAPRIVKGRVIIGNGGGEYVVRGYVSAYDAETGKLDWRFYTVPGDPAHPDGAASDSALARARGTWAADSWERTGGGGGGTVWDSMAYDPELDLLYVGVGNGSAWAKAYRSPKTGGDNDNLFTNSIIALRAGTGEYVWHYQETPGDQWDYDSDSQMILADLAIAGAPRKVLLHAPKNGFFYVLDRATGELLSAHPFAALSWAKSVDLRTGRPVVDPAADYSQTRKPWFGLPGSQGAHDWQPMAFNPKTGLVYIPQQEAAAGYALDPHYTVVAKGPNIGVDMGSTTLPTDRKQLSAIRASMKGSLLAWDPVAQKEAWRVPQPGHWNGGVLSTAGNLVFEGNEDGQFAAYDAATGARLWSFDAESAIMAAPIAWSKDGKEYITVVVGWGGSEGLAPGPLSWTDEGPRVNRSRVLTFALDGQAKLPPPEASPVPHAQSVRQFASVAEVEQGRLVYHRVCFTCHGFGAMSAGLVPDLRYSPLIAGKAPWASVVSDGILAERGMVGFKGEFSPAEIEAVRAYIIDRAHATAN